MARIILFITTIFCLSAMQIFAGTYSGGSGTSGDPYQIATTDDLIQLSNTSGDWSSGTYFIQTASITFDSDETQVDWDGDGSLEWPGDDEAGFSPIGNSIDEFEGSYDGDDYTISNLYIDRSSDDYIGLFGDTDGAEISDIGIINCDITGDDYVGGLVGYNNNSSTVSNSYSTGDIAGDFYVGGLVGWNETSTVSNSFSKGIVSGTGDRVGGLVGYNYFSSTVSNSYSTGDVTRSSGTFTSFGGFCGSNGSADIEYCYSTGDVNVGVLTDKGFVGDDFGTNTYTDNFFDKDASNQNTDAVGAATPETTANMKKQSTFSTWNFTSTWAMSSIISFDEYPTLQWTGGYSVAPSGSNIATLMNLVWVAEDDTRWAGNYTQTADINMWTTPSWDDNQGWTPIGNLTNYFTGSYDGDGFTISNLYFDRGSTSYIGLFGYTDGSTIENIGIIDCNITGYWYVGGLVGRNATSTVSNSYSTGDVSGADYYVGGLVGYSYDSDISNSFSSGSISGHDNVGGLVGYSYESDISNSYSTGNVSGSDYVGGIVGYNTGGIPSTSNISNSYSSGIVSGADQVGGLVGYNYDSDINNSYNSGDVSGNDYVGGLVGRNLASTVSNSYSTGDVTRSSGSGTIFGGFCGFNNASTIEYCYSIGDVIYDGATDPTNKGFVGDDIGSNTYTDNFFDSDASNQNTDAIGAATPKTTSEMKTQSTFTGWDFTPTPHDWNIQSGSYISYPYLQVFTYDTPGATPEVNPIPGLEEASPTVTTNATDDIAATTATGNGEITNTGAANADERGFLLWDYDDADKETGDAGVTEYDETGSFGIGTFDASLTSLTPNTRYNIRAYAENSAGTGYGDRDDFWTLAATPSAPTVDNPDLNTLDVTINPNGNPATVDYVIEETTTNQYVQAGGALGGSEVWQDAATWGTVTVTGLSAGTEYTFRVKARNDDSPQVETSYGATASAYTTGLPVLSTLNITVIGNEQAQSGGEITDGGDSPITAKGLVWNTTGSPTLSDNSTDEGGGSSDFTSIMDNLNVNQTYYVRAYATNSYGTSYGDEKTFVYTAIPTLPEWGLIVLGSLVVIFAVRKLLV